MKRWMYVLWLVPYVLACYLLTVFVSRFVPNPWDSLSSFVIGAIWHWFGIGFLIQWRHWFDEKEKNADELGTSVDLYSCSTTGTRG